MSTVARKSGTNMFAGEALEEVVVVISAGIAATRS